MKSLMQGWTTKVSTISFLTRLALRKKTNNVKKRNTFQGFQGAVLRSQQLGKEKEKDHPNAKRRLN